MGRAAPIARPLRDHPNESAHVFSLERRIGAAAVPRDRSQPSRNPAGTLVAAGTQGASAGCEARRSTTGCRRPGVLSRTHRKCPREAGTPVADVRVMKSAGGPATASCRRLPSYRESFATRIWLSSDLAVVRDHRVRVGRRDVDFASIGRQIIRLPPGLCRKSRSRERVVAKPPVGTVIVYTSAFTIAVQAGSAAESVAAIAVAALATVAVPAGIAGVAAIARAAEATTTRVAVPTGLAAVAVPSGIAAVTAIAVAALAATAVPAWATVAVPAWATVAAPAWAARAAPAWTAVAAPAVATSVAFPAVAAMAVPAVTVPARATQAAAMTAVAVPAGIAAVPAVTVPAVAVPAKAAEAATMTAMAAEAAAMAAVAKTAEATAVTASSARALAAVATNTAEATAVTAISARALAAGAAKTAEAAMTAEAAEAAMPAAATAVTGTTAMSFGSRDDESGLIQRDGRDHGETSSQNQLEAATQGNCARKYRQSAFLDLRPHRCLTECWLDWEGRLVDGQKADFNEFMIS